MPAKSKAQQRLMGVAYAVKKGDMQLSDVDASYMDEVKDLVDNMSLGSLKKYAATKHDGLPERVPENIQVGQINGMGPVELPADGLLGSGDVPAGRGDAEEEYKKKKKKMANFEEFISGLNQSRLSEAKERKYDNVDIQTAWVDAFGKKYDIFDEFPDVIDDVMNDYRDKATIQDLYDIWDDRYGEEPPQEFIDVLVQESAVTEAKKYTVKDVLSAWEDAFGEDMRETDRADIPDDIEADYRGKVTVKDLQEIYDDRYGEELEPEFLEALGESVVNEIRMSAWGDLVYTEDQVNTEHGWCGTLAHELGDDKAMFLTHQSIHELQKSHMGLTAWEALAVLNSKAGRHAAEAYLGGDAAASDAVSALIWYYGSKAKVKKHAKEERELQFPSEK